MPVVESAILAGATFAGKIVIKYVWARTPGKLIKQATKADYEVTRMIEEICDLLTEQEFENIDEMRQFVQGAKDRAGKPKFIRILKERTGYIVVARKYYLSAIKLLKMVERTSDEVRRERGLQSLRMLGQQGEETAHLSFKNIIVHPGDCIVDRPLPIDKPHVLSMDLRMRPLSAHESCTIEQTDFNEKHPSDFRTSDVHKVGNIGHETHVSEERSTAHEGTSNTTEKGPGSGEFVQVPCNIAQDGIESDEDSVYFDIEIMDVTELETHREGQM